VAGKYKGEIISILWEYAWTRWETGDFRASRFLSNGVLCKVHIH
jgi:hypothetical protein